MVKSEERREPRPKLPAVSGPEVPKPLNREPARILERGLDIDRVERAREVHQLKELPAFGKRVRFGGR